MSKFYNIEIKLNKRWTLVESKTRHDEALEYVRENSGEKYPMRIIRVVRTIVFEETK